MINPPRAKPLCLLLALSVSACATCQTHPVACAIAGGVVAGSVAYTLEMNSGDHRVNPVIHHADQGLGPEVRP
jgi:hypothetical protein